MTGVQTCALPIWGGIFQEPTGLTDDIEIIFPDDLNGFTHTPIVQELVEFPEFGIGGV